MFGNALITGALIASLIAIFKTKLLKLTSILSLFCVTLTSLYLWWLIFNDQFDIAYVANYSSSTLSTVFKISAFWAGQQGSFLLWLLFHASAGAILTFRKTPPAALRVYYFLQFTLIILVLAKSPFELSEVVLNEGVGLNPLLQDFWMAIHPPIIFLGYALLAVPISLSLGELLTAPASRDWLESARCWTLIAWAFLGAGIFVGGYWAYKVLGWGGYWGWDPVENSSLVPWLLSAVLLHFINLSKSKPAVLPVTHLAAIFTYSLVIYGTFLTRSGILGDFSVHSFAGSNIGLVISIVNAIILIGGLTILFVKLQYMPKEKMYETFSERAFLILLGALIIIFIAIIVWIGMSMPLLTQMLEKPSSVDTEFYVKTTSPLALVIAVLIITSFIKYKFKSISVGGIITHIAVLTGLLAILISSNGDSTSKELMPNVEENLLGHKVTYKGQEFIEGGKEKFYIYEVDGETVKALTKLRLNGEDAAREPAILRNIVEDIYIAPTPPKSEVNEVLLNRRRFTMGNEFGFVFEDSEILTDENDQPTAAKVTISITDGNKATATGGTSEAIPFWNDTKRIRLTGISGDESKARIEILPSLENLSKMPITTTISTKPFIWLLWLSATSIVIGTLLSIK